MKNLFISYKIPFIVPVLAAAIISFNGSFDLSVDEDAIESENLILSSVSISTDNQVSNLNASVQLSRHIDFTSQFTLADTIILPANPCPANNGLSAAGAGILFNLIGGPRDLFITMIKTAFSAAAGAPVRFEVYIGNGNALGGPVDSGPVSSLAGWTLIDTADGILGPEKSYVVLRVYDASGREVARLASGEFTAGAYRVNWGAGNLSSGVYFYRIQSGGFTQTRKLLLVK